MDQSFARPRRWAGGRHRMALAAFVSLVGALVLGLVLTVGAGGAPPERLAAFSLPRLGPSGASGADPVQYPVAGTGAGRPVVLVFFASWCVLCRTDLPVVARVAAAERRSGNAAAFIGIDGNDPAAAGWAFARATGVRFPIASDQTEQVARQIGLTGLPDTVVVDAAGRVVQRLSGVVDAAQLERAVAAVAPANAVVAASG